MEKDFRFLVSSVLVFVMATVMVGCGQEVPVAPASTAAATEAPVSSVVASTEASTVASTEASTEAVTTEASTEASTEVSADVAEATTEASTEAATEVATEVKASTPKTETATTPATSAEFSATDIDNILKTYANAAEFANMKDYKDMFDNYIVPFAQAQGFKVSPFEGHDGGYSDYELNLDNGKYHVWCQTYWDPNGKQVNDYSFAIRNSNNASTYIYPIGSVQGSDNYPTTCGQYTSATALEQVLSYLATH